MTSPTYSTPEPIDWRDNDLVKDHIAQAALEVASGAASDFRNFLQYYALRPEGDRYDSPLEVVWAVWWDALCRVNGRFREWFDLELQHHVECGGQRYRLDFVVALETDTLQKLTEAHLVWPRIGIELDGHAFHEKTRDQVTYRNQRDRLLQQADWKIFHFSFSEMTTTPIDCVAEVLCFARDLRHALINEAAKRRVSTPQEDAVIKKLFEGLAQQNG